MPGAGDRRGGDVSGPIGVRFACLIMIGARVHLGGTPFGHPWQYIINREHFVRAERGGPTVLPGSDYLTCGLLEFKKSWVPIASPRLENHVGCWRPGWSRP